MQIQAAALGGRLWDYYVCIDPLKLPSAPFSAVQVKPGRIVNPTNVTNMAIQIARLRVGLGSFASFMAFLFWFIVSILVSPGNRLG